MATFGSVVDAIGCAVAVQQATKRWPGRQRRPWPSGSPSVGEVTFEGDDVFGAPVVEAGEAGGRRWRRAAAI
jgi:hypothetical protein